MLQWRQRQGPQTRGGQEGVQPGHGSSAGTSPLIRRRSSLQLLDYGGRLRVQRRGLTAPSVGRPSRLGRCQTVQGAQPPAESLPSHLHSWLNWRSGTLGCRGVLRACFGLAGGKGLPLLAARVDMPAAPADNLKPLQAALLPAIIGLLLPGCAACLLSGLANSLELALWIQ